MTTQTVELKDAMILNKPEFYSFKRDGIHFFVDGESPNWIAVDSRGAKILDLVNGKRPFSEILRRYSDIYDLDMGRSWSDVHTFIREALRTRILDFRPCVRRQYKGRSMYLETSSLKEFWMHIVQTCNLSCSHCLVSSCPNSAGGPDTRFYTSVIDQAYELGARRYFFTGGEPFMRDDVFELIRYVTEHKKAELVILTNATLFQGSRLTQLDTLDREKIKFQASLDGTSPEVNDHIRGQGVFAKASEGLKTLSRLGFDTSLTAVVTRSNLNDLEKLPFLARNLGAKSVHLMWPHKRGRILETCGQNAFPIGVEMLPLVRRVKKNSDEAGIVFDNVESLKMRVNGQPFIKYDLGNLCWDSLCLYIDGHLYPSAATAGIPSLSLGDTRKQSVRSLWLDSAVAKVFREATLLKKPALAGHPFRFLTGGGDMEHGYFFSANGREFGASAPPPAAVAPALAIRQGSLLADDPYHEIYVELIKDIMMDLASSGKNNFNIKSGFNPPVIYCAMGKDSIACSEDALNWLTEQGIPEVKLLHSNCVLSFDVEKPYRIIRQFYGKAAVKPQKELCCPVKYSEDEVGHIPREVLERFYGCGSPVSKARIQPGETVLDLGSGAGIDCFIAAKKVGAEGKVIGVDMTDEMLRVAGQCKGIVARNLDYDIVEFKKGYLEAIPVEDKSVDLVTSNCVINLSPNKRKVFAEIWRVLKDNGRMVVADVVSDRPVPLSLQAHRDLWGECISGALSQEEFLSSLESAGFYGISILGKIYWKDVEGHKFYSITVRAFKFEKRSGCSFIGQKAVYLGPQKAVLDEEGHLFPRGELVEVCTDTAAKLKALPYAGYFTVLEPDRETTACCSKTHLAA